MLEVKFRFAYRLSIEISDTNEGVTMTSFATFNEIRDPENETK